MIEFSIKSSVLPEEDNKFLKKLISFPYPVIFGRSVQSRTIAVVVTDGGFMVDEQTKFKDSAKYYHYQEVFTYANPDLPSPADWDVKGKKGYSQTEGEFYWIYQCIINSFSFYLFLKRIKKEQLLTVTKYDKPEPLLSRSYGLNLDIKGKAHFVADLLIGGFEIQELFLSRYNFSTLKSEVGEGIPVFLIHEPLHPDFKKKVDEVYHSGLEIINLPDLKAKLESGTGKSTMAIKSLLLIRNPYWLLEP